LLEERRITLEALVVAAPSAFLKLSPSSPKKIKSRLLLRVGHGEGRCLPDEEPRCTAAKIRCCLLRIKNQSGEARTSGCT
ncbi:hypothetical protein KUDE01_010907, partial [Dissostichus eleginoides]